ncbi:DUF6339 family protein [Polaribacter sp. SA4-12]|uniref:DUF6339 family protein n=1 Tax=Polaribacter sp. SA4-12 TaxID=1312072 RepID=UPI000B3BF860|nr:DUF6339 family protein [Polaribacter sp. SA4-12]ARV16639.1 hypothetical protein BTO07_16505 [Polaribacter sp. SA4-12]
MAKIFTTESLSFLRDEFKNYIELEDFLRKYQNEAFDFSAIELVEDSDYPELLETKINEFYESFDNNPKDEFSLAKILYEGLQINENQASNNLFWLYLNLGPFFSFIKNRWIQKWNENDEKLRNDLERFLLSIEPSHNSLIKSPIAGLWWAIHLTIDHSLEDKYYYSKVFLSERNLRDKNIGSYQLIRDKKVLQAVLDFYNTYKNKELNGKRIGSEAIAQQMIKTLNQIGGLTVLSYLDKDEVFQKMEKFKETIFLRAREVQLGKKASRIRLEILRNNDKGNLINEASQPIIKTEQKEAKSIDKNDKQEKVLKYFNLRNNGEYNLTNTKVDSFFFQTAIRKNFENGYLLICYNESGYINRIKISKLLQKQRELYQNGVYFENTVNRILTIPKRSILGIIYSQKGVKYFKAILSDQLKDNNGNVGLQGYKTMPFNYDTIEYIPLPINLEVELSRLIFKSFNASGKSFNNPNYKKEFKIINHFGDNTEFKLF